MPPSPAATNFDHLGATFQDPLVPQSLSSNTSIGNITAATSPTKVNENTSLHGPPTDLENGTAVDGTAADLDPLHLAAVAIASAAEPYSGHLSPPQDLSVLGGDHDDDFPPPSPLHPSHHSGELVQHRYDD